MTIMGHLSFFFRNREALTIGLVFSFNSFLFGNWVTRLPDLKTRLDITDGELGLALLGAPIGAMIVMPFVGWIIAKYQLGRTTFWTSLIHLAAPILLSTVPSYGLLIVGMAYFGFSNALMDISMNSVAAVTEKKLGRTIMSTCHGMWSLGAMLGAATGSFFVGFGSGIEVHLITLSSLVIVALVVLGKRIRGYEEEIEEHAKTFAFPNLSLLGLAFIGFCIMLSEGAVADWSAIFMRESLQSDPYLIGFAYAGFSGLMAAGRFVGDAAIPKFGNKPIVVWGGVISVLGLLIISLTLSPVVAIIGFALTGLGYSCIIPVIFSSAASEPGYTSGTGIAAVTTLSYVGFLAGPPFIGFLSDMYSLHFGFALLLVLAIMVSILGSFIKLR